MRTGPNPGREHPVTKPQLDRMFELRALDVSYRAIARIITHDWERPVEMDPSTVAYHLKGRVPKKPRKPFPKGNTYSKDAAAKRKSLGS